MCYKQLHRGTQIAATCVFLRMDACIVRLSRIHIFVQVGLVKAKNRECGS
jgi:hypothetical protein